MSAQEDQIQAGEQIPCDGFTGSNAWGECVKCGDRLEEHAVEGESLGPVVDGSPTAVTLEMLTGKRP